MQNNLQQSAYVHMMQIDPKDKTKTKHKTEL